MAKIIQGYAYSEEILKHSEEISKLHSDIFKENVEFYEKHFVVSSDIEYKETFVILLELNSELIGMAMIVWLKNPKCWYMYNFGIKTSLQKQGYGNILWEGVLEKTKGSLLIWTADNQTAIDFYLKRGAQNSQFNGKEYYWISKI